jgi:hypothetical protein
MMAYAYSFDGNDFSNSGYDSIKEALKDAKKDAASRDDKPTHCFIGEQIEFKPEIDADMIFDQLKDKADEFSYEYAEDYLVGVSDEEKKDLEKSIQKVFEEWEERTGNKATFFQIEDSKKYYIELRCGLEVSE